MSPSLSLSRDPNIILIGHGNIAQAFAQQLRVHTGREIYAVT